MKQKKEVLKYIGTVMKEYNIPLTKKTILEVSEYLNDFMEDVDSSTNGENKPLSPERKQLFDRILSNPALRSEMEAFVLLLMQEAEKQKREESQTGELDLDTSRQ